MSESPRPRRAWIEPESEPQPEPPRRAVAAPSDTAALQPAQGLAPEPPDVGQGTRAAADSRSTEAASAVLTVDRPDRLEAAVRESPDSPVVSRAMPIRAEIRRQLRRRRTQGIFIVLAVLPLVLLLAFWLGNDDNNSGQRGFVDLAQVSGANLTVFTMFASTGFLFIVVVALFAGDTVPSEASWSSLRYLLAAPVRRERLLRQKLVVAALSSIVALVFLPAWTLVVGGIAYGWGAYEGPTGDQLKLPTFLVRLLLIIGYLLIELSVVAAFAFTLGVLTDAPLAAVGGAVLLMILSAILDSITALGGIRQGLPGHYAFAWANALQPAVDYSDMVRGALWSIGYAVVLISFAVWHFVRKDITS